MKWEDRFPNRQFDDEFSAYLKHGNFVVLASRIAGEWMGGKKFEAAYEFFAMNGQLAVLLQAIDRDWEDDNDEDFE